MNSIPFSALVAFVLAGTFSPGPNNTMSATLGIMHGYRRTFPFIVGITCGFAVVMLLCAAASAVLLRAMPAIGPLLKYVGAGYVLWLAWVTWSHRSAFGQAVGDDAPASQGFWGGFGLQFVNPKGVVYGLMVYSTFLGVLVGIPIALASSALLLALVGFTSISMWALAGSALRRWLRTDRDRAIAAGALAAMLLYTAVEMAEIPALVAHLLAASH